MKITIEIKLNTVPVPVDDIVKAFCIHLLVSMSSCLFNLNTRRELVKLAEGG